MPIDLPNLEGKADYDVVRAIHLLWNALDTAQAKNAELVKRIEALPPQLTLEEIQAALGPQGTHTLPTAALLNTTPPETTPTPPTPAPNTVPDHSDIVNAVYATHPVGPTSTLEEIFRFTQAVAWEVLASATDPDGFTCGLLYKPSGENIFTCAGVSYSISRVCYPNGQIFKVLADAGLGGSNTPQWVDNGTVDPSSYRPATNPSSPC